MKNLTGMHPLFSQALRFGDQSEKELDYTF